MFGKIKNMSPRQFQSFLFMVMGAIGVLLAVIAVLFVIPYVPYKVYKNSQYNIQMKYPAYWGVRENTDKIEDLVVAFYTPRKSKEDIFSENVNVSVKKVPMDPIDMNQLSQIMIRQLTGTIGDNMKVLESSPTQLSGRPAHRLVFVGEDIETPLQYQIVWALDGSKVYIITYVARSEDYLEYLGEVQAMIRSFKIR
jgi:eukaryotic-like serine/threonine-protein kinase